MKPNESVRVSDFPGEPVAADPVEVLAYALWNEGKQDEAIAVLERQIALEKKLARGNALPSPVQRPEMTLFPLPEVMKAPVRRQPAPARAANQNDAQSRRTFAGPERAKLQAGADRALPVRIDPVTSWPRPSRRTALLSGVLLLLLGGAGLWASTDRNDPLVVDAKQQATTQEQPVPVASVAPAREDAANEAAVDSPAEPVAAVAPPTPADLPQDSEPPAEFDEPPAEELPSQATLTNEPPSEDLSLPEPELAVPDARVPRARAEPPAPEAARTPQTAPAPRTPPTAPRPSQPQQATREPAPRPPTDSRSERSRRLAERREAAERYVARRRAEAERSAAAKRQRAARAPDGQGPSILLGGRGLPN